MNTRELALQHKWRNEWRTSDRPKQELLKLIERATEDLSLRLQIIEAARNAWKPKQPPRFDVKPGRGGEMPQPFVRVGNPFLPGNTVKVMLPKQVLAPVGWLIKKFQR